MDDNTITIEKARLAELLKQNQEMKAVINKGALVINQIVDITGLTGANGNLFLKIPQILIKLQRNPEVINDLEKILQEFAKYID